MKEYSMVAENSRQNFPFESYRMIYKATNATRSEVHMCNVQ